MLTGWNGPSPEGPARASGSLCTHLLLVVGGVEPVVEAGSVGQTQDLFKQVFGQVLEGGFEDKVANLSVLLVTVMAEIDEVLDVVMGADVLHVLSETDEQLCVLLVNTAPQLKINTRIISSSLWRPFVFVPQLTTNSQR